MSGPKITLLLAVALLVGALSYIGSASRQAAQASAEVRKAATGRAALIDREIEETSKMMSGQRR